MNLPSSSLYTPVSPGGLNALEMVSVKERLDAVEKAQQQQQAPVPFSEVGSGVAEGILGVCGIEELDGNLIFPIAIPAEGPQCYSFDYSRFSSERDGTPQFMKHHQEQLERCGVTFGRGGYAMYDLQGAALSFSFVVQERVYKGTSDCCIGPYGLLGASRARNLRVVFEHKLPGKKGTGRTSSSSMSSATVSI